MLICSRVRGFEVFVEAPEKYPIPLSRRDGDAAKPLPVRVGHPNRSFLIMLEQSYGMFALRRFALDLPSLKLTLPPSVGLAQPTQQDRRDASLLL